MKALTTAAASNQRFLATDGEYDMQQLADIIHTSPSITTAVKARVPRGKPGARLTRTHYKVANTKAKQTLGLEDPSLEETVVELVLQLLEVEANDTAQP